MFFRKLRKQTKDPKTTTGGIIALVAALLNVLCTTGVVCLDIPSEVLNTIMAAGIAIVGWFAKDKDEEEDEGIE